MPQVFHRSANSIARNSILAVLVLLNLAGFGIWMANRSPLATKVGVAREQPVPFSHQHHVAGLGIDCRYCHTTVERSSFAGIPPTSTCMNCHSQIWTSASMLEPVRASFRTGTPLQWTRVHDVPDFVKFNHSIHVNKGFGCESCHGRVDQMPLMWKAQPMTMSWCLECHRNPEKFIRPKNQITTMGWRAPNQAKLGAQLVRDYRVRRMTQCSSCHY